MTAATRLLEKKREMLELEQVSKIRSQSHVPEKVSLSVSRISSKSICVSTL